MAEGTLERTACSRVFKSAKLRTSLVVFAAVFEAGALDSVRTPL